MLKNNKVKNTNFENVYYYMGWYILIDEKTKMYYVSRKSCAGGYNGSKEFAINLAVKHIEKTERDDNELYENIEHKLCSLVKKDLTNMIYNAVQHEKGME